MADKEMAEYILQVLKGNNIFAFWAWGAEKFQVLSKPRGLRFKVNGAVFKGWIRVEYNASDYFDVTFENNGKVSTFGTDKEVLKDVDCFQLKDMIDSRVEGNWQG